MHRAKVADALLPQIIIEQEAEIAIISEQYKKNPTGIWLEDDTQTAAIWIPTGDLSSKENGKGNGFVWAWFDNLTVISCYLTPSDNVDAFQRKLDEIEDLVRDRQGPIILAGDFNARSPEWGMPTTNFRGSRIVQMAARAGLTVANVGNTPTFRRHGCEGTIPDITLVSENEIGHIKNWKVLEIYTASDHQYISYSFETTRATSENGRKQWGTRIWNVGKLNASALMAEIDRRMDDFQQTEDALDIVDKVMKIMKKACDKSMPRLGANRHKKKAVYWWSETIADARRECLRARRKYTRAKRRGEAITERDDYRAARKRLQAKIFNSKRQLWEELREDINRDPWGTGYKLVMGKLSAKRPAKQMDPQTMQNIVTFLFPQNNAPEERLRPREIPHIPLFTQKDLEDAARKLKANKAPGPDGIPAEIIKEVALKRPQMMLQMYNSCLQEGIFPDEWKRQQLVLISKGKGDPDSPSAYRPLCLLDTAGKLFERLLKPRLIEAVDAAGGLSERQHGFRPRRSTIGAIGDVVNIVEAAQSERARPLVILATLDVKNAFNSLRWPDVLKAIEERFRIPQYLTRVIRDYLKNRVLIYNTTEGQRRIEVTSGAAQGSILGPDLWNISYDEILNMEMPQDTFLVGYADDIAAVIKARSMDEAKRKLNQVMIRTRMWLNAHGLQLAAHKTEILLITRKHMPLELDFNVGEVTLTSKRVLNYLGIRLDPKLTFNNQIQFSANKAAKITGKLSRLMANIGGPLPRKRKLLMETTNSILLYGCEIWGEQMRVRKRANILLAVQRTAALRVTSAYRTVSASAILVIAGTLPIDLQVLCRRKMWLKHQTNELNSTTEDQIKQESIRNWQTRWASDTKGRWTAKLIPNLEGWLRRQFGEVNYYLTQMLSGHGYFRKYLHNVNKCGTPFCLYEIDDVIDDAEHTFFKCSRWHDKRRETENITGPLSAENVIEIMMESEEKWKAVEKLCKHILKTKKPDLDASERSEDSEAGAWTQATDDRG